MGKRARVAAGLLMHRECDGRLQVLLAHPGGPLWKNRDLGAWTIPKGEIGDDEEALVAARREFEEETGLRPDGPFVSLGTIRQRSGKRVQAWAFRGDWDPSRLTSNTFAMEWPPRSGRVERFPEIDRARWFDIDEARRRILPAQREFLDALERGRDR